MSKRCCPECNGLGTVPYNIGAQECPTCGGVGKLGMLGRWASKQWFKVEHPLTESDAREVAHKMCTDGDLGLAYQFVDQLQVWIHSAMRHANKAHEHAMWEQLRQRLEFWSGMWHVLLTVTDPSDADYSHKKLKRTRPVESAR